MYPWLPRLLGSPASIVVIAHNLPPLEFDLQRWQRSRKCIQRLSLESMTSLAWCKLDIVKLYQLRNRDTKAHQGQILPGADIRA